jgi:hypothetical protein
LMSTVLSYVRTLALVACFDWIGCRSRFQKRPAVHLKGY